MEEKFLQVNNLKIFIRIAGQGDPFLILHGWGRGLISWIDVQDELSKYFKVFVLDLPGFGKSDLPPKAWNMDDYVSFILSFAKKIGINNFYLLGHSFGGSLAIKLSAQNQGNIKKLILVDSAGKRQGKNFFKKALSRTTSLIKIFSFLPGYSFFRRCFYKFILRSTDYVNASGIMKEVFKNVVSEDLSDTWQNIAIPTLIIWGRRDNITPIADAYLMNKEITNSQLKIFDCGHGVHYEKPKEFIKAILGFLNKNES